MMEKLRRKKASPKAPLKSLPKECPECLDDKAKKQWKAVVVPEADRFTASHQTILIALCRNLALLEEVYNDAGMMRENYGFYKCLDERCGELLKQLGFATSYGSDWADIPSIFNGDFPFTPNNQPFTTVTTTHTA